LFFCYLILIIIYRTFILNYKFFYQFNLIVGEKKKNNNIRGMAFLRRKSKSGFVMEEVYSGLQKSVRRGLEKEALFFSQELGGEFPNALKKRIVMLALEDAPYKSFVLRSLEADVKDKL